MYFDKIQHWHIRLYTFYISQFVNYFFVYHSQWGESPRAWPENISLRKRLFNEIFYCQSFCSPIFESIFFYFCRSHASVILLFACTLSVSHNPRRFSKAKNRVKYHLLSFSPIKYLDSKRTSILPWAKNRRKDSLPFLVSKPRRVPLVRLACLPII